MLYSVALYFSSVVTTMCHAIQRALVITAFLFSLALGTTATGGGKLYWGDDQTGKIQRANLDGSGVEDLVAGGTGIPWGIALDLHSGKMYWTDVENREIHRANLDGSNIEDIVTTGDYSSTPSGLALDLSAGKMYWTDTGLDKIWRANLDGSATEELVTSGIPAATAIALDLNAGKMYWVDSGLRREGMIQRSSLDGSNIEDLRSEEDPTTIALDVATGKMYWGDADLDEMRRSDLDGSDMETLVVVTMTDTRGLVLDLAEGKMYWTDYDPPKIRRANLDGSRIEDVVTQGLGRPHGIAIAPDCNDNGVPDPVDVFDETSLDCNGNEVPDECESDCNENGIPDECDIASGSSDDCNFNGIPDDCEPDEDCNGNEIRDICDIGSEMSDDCNANSVPDECEPDCNENTIPDECDIRDCPSETWCTDCNANDVPDACDVDPTDPDGNDESSPDCDQNGVPDECQPDCDADTIPDACELPPFGTSEDCNYNELPDECEPDQDCNANSVRDICEIADCSPGDRACDDCNLNNTPDECDLDPSDPDGNGEVSDDENGNGVPDECDALAPTLPADPEHQARKNRYISLNLANSPTLPVAYELTLSSMKRCSGDLRRTCEVDTDCPGVCAGDNDLQCGTDTVCGTDGPCIATAPCIEHADVGTSWWIGVPDIRTCSPNDDCVGEFFADVVSSPVFRVWTEETVHVSGCEIVPVATFRVRACRTPDETGCSDSLTVGTIEKPNVHYADVVGPVVYGAFTPPDGFTSVVDISAYLIANQGWATAPHTTWVDLAGYSAEMCESWTSCVVPQQVLGVSDLMTIKFGFIGKTYTETPGQVDPGECP